MAGLLQTAGTVPGQNAIYERLHDVLTGDSVEMNVNGSIVPRIFRWTARDDAYLGRLHFAVIDDSPTVIDGFFSLPALTEGLLVSIFNPENDVQLNFGGTVVGTGIRTSAEFGLLAGVDVDVASFANTSRHIVRWTLSEAFGGALLFVPKGQSLRVIIRDDLSGLAFFNTMVQGAYVRQV